MKKCFYLLPLIYALLVAGPIEAKKKKYPNGDYYEGEWKKGAPYGQGTMKYANGIIYEGFWVEGEKSGQGTMKYADGSIYVGKWKNDEMNGQGKWDYLNGKFEEGFWIDGILDSGNVDVNLLHDGKYHYDEYFTGTIRNGAFYEGKINGYYRNVYYQGILKEGIIFDGLYKKETELYNIHATYSDGKPMYAIVKAKNGWTYKGKINDNGLPSTSGVITSKTSNSIIEINNNWGYIINDNDTISKQQLSWNITQDFTMFNRWVQECYKIEEKLNEEKRRQEEELRRQEEELRRQEEEKFIANQIRKEEEKRWNNITTQIPNYIWEASKIRAIYDNNPARFRSITQNKYVIIGGTIADIDESRNVEYSPIWQDWIEYKYYTVRLAGGIYFESRDVDFISGLNKGDELLCVGTYTDKQSFNRPLFVFNMYAGSIHGLVGLMKKNKLSLNNFVPNSNR